MYIGAPPRQNPIASCIDNCRMHSGRFLCTFCSFLSKARSVTIKLTFSDCQLDRFLLPVIDPLPYTLCRSVTSHTIGFSAILPVLFQNLAQFHWTMPKRWNAGKFRMCYRILSPLLAQIVTSVLSVFTQVFTILCSRPFYSISLLHVLRPRQAPTVGAHRWKRRPRRDTALVGPITPSTTAVTVPGPPGTQCPARRDM